MGNETSSLKLNRQLTGNVGLYYCCYQLSCRGWNIMPTARNARGVDIIAYDEGALHFVGIQVKALSGRDAAGIGRSLDNVLGSYWIIVNRVSSENPQAFILSSEEVKERATQDKGKDQQYWLERKDYDQEQFRNAWERISAP